MAELNEMKKYNYEESFYIKPYFFIKGFATAMNFKHTLKALPLAKEIHDGQYRKGVITMEDGTEVRIPYILHCLKVCSTLISLNLPLPPEELDIMYAAALLHDSYEDGSEFFQHGVSEYTQIYGFPQRLSDIIMLLSKRSGATQEELAEYFSEIQKDVIAAFIKLSDRSHNVEDLYNMKLEKLHKYVVETRQFIYPMTTFMKHNYPDLSNGITILKAKIVSLTELTETIVDMYEDVISAKNKEIETLESK